MWRLVNRGEDEGAVKSWIMDVARYRISAPARVMARTTLREAETGTREARAGSRLLLSCASLIILSRNTSRDVA